LFQERQEVRAFESNGTQLGGQLFALSLSRELTVPEQSDHIFEATVRRELADGVTPIAQLATLSVNGRNRGIGGNDAFHALRWCGVHDAFSQFTIAIDEMLRGDVGHLE
jgi:hypothetical protein